MDLHIDLETYSEVDIMKCGVYKYVDSPSFEILLFGYAFDDEPAVVIDLAQGEEVPARVIAALTDPSITKKAHNANFERTCLQEWTGKPMPPEEWKCSAIRATQLGLPRSLEAVGNALGFKEEDKKSKTGKALIRYFCVPCKPTKSNGGRTRNLPEHDPEKWAIFIDYCVQDVVVERNIDNRLSFYPKETEAEHALWSLDQRMNEGGVLVDMPLVEKVLAYNMEYKEKLTARAIEISGLSNPNSITQARLWLKENGVDTPTLNKEAVGNILEELIRLDIKPEVMQFLMIRKELGKTSVSKYEAMQRSVCHDGRIRGMLQFYGASRTGRWAGRIVQLQNLPQNHIPDIQLVRNLVATDQFDMIELFYRSPLNILSQLIRTCFIARGGMTLVVADYSAIEARVIAWLAGETWVQEVFATHGKIYEATAARMYHIPIESVGHGSDYRKKGKIATLACGYQGGVGALNAMDRKGEIPENEKAGIIADWRASNPHIVKFWYDVEKNAKKAIANPGTTIVMKFLKFRLIRDTLFIKLPNGRSIAYNGAKLEEVNTHGYNRQAITYMGQNQTTQKWERVETYGGKLVENITQATARDCLGTAMLRLKEQGYLVQFHVHDEVIIEVPAASAAEDLEKVKAIMNLNEPWTEGLLITAEGYETPFYMKD